jgi:hypothetical protein
MLLTRAGLVLSTALALTPQFVLAQTPAAAAPGEAASAKIWLNQRELIESYLKTAEVVGMEEIKVGVTRPKRAKLAPGGPVDAIAFKAVAPGRSTGYWESYKSEIAAYELDKVLGLDMVPPTVEKRVNGSMGAAVMWCTSTKSFKEFGGVPSAPPAHFARWNRQLAKAKMFDNLIGNLDPNLGNWLVDPSWNLILIDHTRAFTTDKSMVHKKMDHIDGELWDKMKARTLEGLTPLLSPWMGKGEIKAILQRRDAMAADFDKQMAANPSFVVR